MIANIDEAIEEAYKRELRMIAVNGGGEEALKFRYEQLRKTQADMLSQIELTEIDILGRKKALNETVVKLKRLGKL